MEIMQKTRGRIGIKNSLFVISKLVCKIHLESRYKKIKKNAKWA